MNLIVLILIIVVIALFFIIIGLKKTMKKTKEAVDILTALHSKGKNTLFLLLLGLLLFSCNKNNDDVPNIIREPFPYDTSAIYKGMIYYTLKPVEKITYEATGQHPMLYTGLDSIRFGINGTNLTHYLLYREDSCLMQIFSGGAALSTKNLKIGGISTFTYIQITTNTMLKYYHKAAWQQEQALYDYNCLRKFITLKFSRN